MCGIFGQYNRQGVDPALIERMAQCLDHRGPDGYGTHHEGPLAFGAGRLAIIDLAAGVQPIFSEDRRVAVVYNGEIYNYRALRAELEAQGHHFATGTDTEVIVHGYESWGRDVIARLRGMFALGIWDQPEERLLLARDRLGEKPLYYTQSGDNFLFASEIKALFMLPGLRRAVNPEALPLYLALGYTPPPMTMFAGISKLAPGELLTIDANGLRKDRYWQPHMDTDSQLDYTEAVQQVRQTLTECVEMRLMSDVPLGAFLSGGVDSTAVVALMGRALGRPVQTFTVGFDFESGSKGDTKFNVDAHYAALAAQRLGTDHHAITVKTGSQLADLLPHLVHAMDEPVAQPAIIQTAYVAALARTCGVPVLLSGDASDELFAGYPTYKADRVLERYLQIPRLLRETAITPILDHLPARFDRWRSLGAKSRDTDPVKRYLTWMKIIDLPRFPSLLNDQALATRAFDSISTRLRPLLEAPHTRHFADRIAFTSLNLWIAEDSNMRVDKMSMAMSIETRSPFEDYKLVELALSLPLSYKLRGGDFKAVLKSAVSDLIPQEILTRPKWGFFPPASDWLRTVLRPLVETYLAPERVAAAGCFQPESVTAIVNRHIVEHKYELWPVWSLLVFHLWHALYIDCSLTLDHKLTPIELAADSLQYPN
ncbi:MAG: asparagine synthase (glutamine-hydrolyzing) [Chloroflexota bacterium]